MLRICGLVPHLSKVNYYYIRPHLEHLHSRKTPERPFLFSPPSSDLQKDAFTSIAFNPNFMLKWERWLVKIKLCLLKFVVRDILSHNLCFLNDFLTFQFILNLVTIVHVWLRIYNPATTKNRLCKTCLISCSWTSKMQDLANGWGNYDPSLKKERGDSNVENLNVDLGCFKLQQRLNAERLI